MAVENKFENAIERFDAANKEDPNTELWQGKTYPKELLYAIRMTDKLKSFAPNASEALQLTARSQHIQRWEIPRDTFEMGRKGYLKWRQTLQKFHVEKASFILKEVGYEQEIIDQCIESRQLKDKLELNKYDPLARKHAKYVETKKNLGRNEVKPRKG